YWDACKEPSVLDRQKDEVLLHQSRLETFPVRFRSAFRFTANRQTFRADQSGDSAAGYSARASRMVAGCRDRFNPDSGSRIRRKQMGSHLNISHSERVELVR